VACDSAFGDGKRFIDLYPHPFWIVVLLITMQYGTSEGLAATVLAIVFLYFRNIPERLVEESTFDYQFRISLRPFLWFSVAFVLGELRMRLQHQIDQLREGRDKATEHAQAIAKNYEVLKAMKESLEARLVGQISTVATTYETVRGLETLKPTQILTCLDKIVQTTLNPQKFSVFSFGPHGLEATTSQGWTDEDTFLRRFSIGHPLHREIVERKRMVCIVNQDDEQIFDGEGVIAGPLIDRNTGEVFGMIKIEEIDFFKLDIGNMETFKTLCDLVGSAYSNAKKYKMAMANAIYEEEMGIFSYKLYSLFKNFLRNLCITANIPLSYLSIKLQGADELMNENERAIISEIYSLLMGEIAEGTAIFQGKEKIMYQILLANTTVKQAKKLSLSILDAIQKNSLLSKYRFSFSVESLYEPQDQAALTK
ncbi:MAG: GAF domain-containing protein, partial [Waddliaceae bacterium]